jgi:C4-type Zn-finger protein
VKILGVSLASAERGEVMITNVEGAVSVGTIGKYNKMYPHEVIRIPFSS